MKIKTINMVDINEVTHGLVTMDYDRFETYTGEERVEIFNAIKKWAEQSMDWQERWNEQADKLFNRELGINQ
jgi:starvation-inducible outer membrane lipoprotein